MGDEVINDVVVVEEMVIQAGLTCNKVGKSLNMSTRLRVTPFQERKRMTQ